MSTQLVSRLKSLAWRVGMVSIAAGAVELSVGIPGLKLPEIATVLIGLVLGEVSKYINNRLDENKK
jgi:tetrahydromethanopterin S-methyltransferase subunit C